VPLNPGQQELIKAALSPHLKGCPICHTTQWELAQDLVFLPSLTVDGSINMSSGQPCISAICRTCGSVQLFNVFRLGIAEKIGIKRSDA
jgi:hypothetical protein